MKTTKLIISYGPFEPDELANILRWVADFIDEDEATSYTGDDLCGALSRLHESSGRMLVAVDHVRGSRVARRRT